ncbi:MAG: Holliday junction branch migration protein RuvA [Methylotenera sp.]|nr:Holliday junction branch migration protein RuvA [Oligoflexia bacterium]
MIGYLAGRVLEHVDGKMIVVLPSAEGAVGYQVLVPHSAAYGAWSPGKSIELFIYTHVREDSLDLYGFSTREEKELFLTLLTVNGIGPKGGLGILSKVDPAQLIQAILTGDKESLTAIPGIGKKTAERVVLELADPLRKKVDAGSFGKISSGGGAGSTSKADPAFLAGSAVLKDAKDALIGLGYREQDVLVLLKRVNESKSPPKKVEDVIRMALQSLA